MCVREENESALESQKGNENERFLFVCVWFVELLWKSWMFNVYCDKVQDNYNTFLLKQSTQAWFGNRHYHYWILFVIGRSLTTKTIPDRSLGAPTNIFFSATFSTLNHDFSRERNIDRIGCFIFEEIFAFFLRLKQRKKFSDGLFSFLVVIFSYFFR